MTPGPADVTLDTIASCVLLAAATAVTVIVYAVLALVQLLPASLSTADITGLPF